MANFDADYLDAGTAHYASQSHNNNAVYFYAVPVSVATSESQQAMKVIQEADEVDVSELHSTIPVGP